MIDLFKKLDSAKEGNIMSTVFDFEKSLTEQVKNYPPNVWTDNKCYHLFKAKDGIRMQVAKFIRCEMYCLLPEMKRKVNEAVLPASDESFLLLHVKIII